MRIELAGWESDGLRCPDIAVDLRRGGRVRQVTLIQMASAVGKTTIVQLLGAALSGSARHWRPDDVRAFRRSGDDRSTGRFKVALLVAGTPLSTELHLDYGAGRASYRTTIPEPVNAVPRWGAPLPLDRFLARESVRLFVVDGMFPRSLVNSGQKEAEGVVDALWQLHLPTVAQASESEDRESIGESLRATGTPSRERIKRELVDVCNRRLAVLFENDPPSMTGIEGSIQLRDRFGGNAAEPAFAVGYTFLTGALQRGGNDFPLIVDDPAAAMDLGARRRLGRLLPLLCNQFVALVCNTGHEGFAEGLETEAGDIGFLTVFRKADATRRVGRALPRGRYKETDDAVLVEDKEYFLGFDVE